MYLKKNIDIYDALLFRLGARGDARVKQTANKKRRSYRFLERKHQCMLTVKVESFVVVLAFVFVYLSRLRSLFTGAGQLPFHRCIAVSPYIA